MHRDETIKNNIVYVGSTTIQLAYYSTAIFNSTETTDLITTTVTQPTTSQGTDVAVQKISQLNVYWKAAAMFWNFALFICLLVELKNF